MKKVRTIRDLYIPGWGTIRKGSEFKVDKYNTRFVYIILSSGANLRLARKGDVEKVY